MNLEREEKGKKTKKKGSCSNVLDALSLSRAREKEREREFVSKHALVGMPLHSCTLPSRTRACTQLFPPPFPVFLSQGTDIPACRCTLRVLQLHPKTKPFHHRISLLIASTRRRAHERDQRRALAFVFARDPTSRFDVQDSLSKEGSIRVLRWRRKKVEDG